jgi:pyrroline-5-carboxylate reductase
MGSALIKGLISSGIKPNTIFASDHNSEQLKKLKALQITTSASNLEIAKSAEVVILCVKPQLIAEVIQEVASVLTKNHLIVSIAAGVTLKSLSDALPKEKRSVVRLARVMPNTPSLVRQGVSSFSLEPNSPTSKSDAALITAIFSSVGFVFQTDEKLIHAVVAVSGCGPAYDLFLHSFFSFSEAQIFFPSNSCVLFRYVYLFIEALADGLCVGVASPVDFSLSDSFAVQPV